MTAALSALRDELRAATEATDDLADKVVKALLFPDKPASNHRHVWLYRNGDPLKSLDAADALRREVLPGWRVYEACWHDGYARFELGSPRLNDASQVDYVASEHAVTCIAYVTAIVEAKIKEMGDV